MRETLSVQLALQDSDPAKGTFKGLASVFGNLIDAYVPTRILPGAFTKTLQENMKRIKILYQHDPSSPIGVPTVLKETSDGLYVEGRISQTALGRDCVTLMQDGVITEMSIGHDPIKFQTVVEQALGPVRHITELRLWEISPVTFAADSKALIHSIHSMQNVFATRVEEMDADLVERFRTHFAITAPEAPEFTAEDLLSRASALTLETFQGKVLSGANRALIVSAVEALNKILDAAEPKTESSLTVAFARSKVAELELGLRLAHY